jgi:hypothetical protein
LSTIETSILSDAGFLTHEQCGSAAAVFLEEYFAADQVSKLAATPCVLNAPSAQETQKA